jgi:DNA-binding protein H-NS
MELAGIACQFLETLAFMTTSDFDLNAISLEELELLTQRKREQLHQEAVDKQAQLESEIAQVSQQIEELRTRKEQLETELRAVNKSLGNGSGDRTSKRAPRKPKKPAEAEPLLAPEA